MRHRLTLMVGLLVSACSMDPMDDSRPAAGAARQVTIGDVLWYVDYEAAREIARVEDKALWVHFGENPG
jgi:hypothetical protein